MTTWRFECSHFIRLSSWGRASVQAAERETEIQTETETETQRDPERQKETER